MAHVRAKKWGPWPWPPLPPLCRRPCYTTFTLHSNSRRNFTCHRMFHMLGVEHATVMHLSVKKVKACLALRTDVWLLPMSGSSPCLTPPHVWLLPMSGSSPCLTPPHVWLIPMSDSSPCLAPPHVWLLPMSDSSPCLAPSHVWLIPMSGSSPCLAPPHV